MMEDWTVEPWIITLEGKIVFSSCGCVPMSGSSVFECTALSPGEKSPICFFISRPLKAIVGEKWLLVCLENNHLWAEIEKLNLKILCCIFLESCFIEPS